MDIPYGFDCFAFSSYQVKHFESNISKTRASYTVPPETIDRGGYRTWAKSANISSPYIRFTRKNEDYTNEQLNALAQAGRLDPNEFQKQIFCGPKIQIGIGVVTNFLQKGLQYRRPIKGKSELINGSWTGIVSGLTIDENAPNSYDVAFGNFLAYEEEFPYVKFGPFYAIESKLVMLTGSSRGVEASSFGTNIGIDVWSAIISSMLIMSLLAYLRVHWQISKHRILDSAFKKLLGSCCSEKDLEALQENISMEQKDGFRMMHEFFFIYFTMLLNKPSHEFDELIWSKHSRSVGNETRKFLQSLLRKNQDLRKHRAALVRKEKRKHLPTSVRLISYLWSAACLIMASIYSGEMLAVILLQADQNIDSIAQLINARPPIEPVFRQDDFTYLNLMPKSLDQNMLTLYNKSKIIPRSQVYDRRFIRNVSERKQALLGDDELIETIYDIYHKQFPLYRAKVTYLQYPISMMYRKNFNVTLENELRRGIVQIFEMGLIHRWYQAQKETYVQFYDTYEKKDHDQASSADSIDSKYKNLTMNHFESFFKLMSLCILVSFLVLAVEIAVHRLRIIERKNRL